MIDFTDDAPELTPEQLAEMRPARDVLTPEQFAAVTGRGRPRSEVRKVPVTLRLNPLVLEAYKAGGKGWQTRMQEALSRDIGVERTQTSGKVKSLAAGALLSKGGAYEIVGPRGGRTAKKPSGDKKRA